MRRTYQILIMQPTWEKPLELCSTQNTHNATAVMQALLDCYDDDITHVIVRVTRSLVSEAPVGVTDPEV